ncbi:hypothetical protein [Pedobacter cryotolerans]|uniref:Uncharacterized protein n=1 Tax=Pedobacter cryotolerans TaxID=2571270 RepID=A0A4U1CEJ5_9SPHI|nr:hypothetical protein [Pedobacter cryotolerans]TKC02634.1 hypothetical protein FA045_04995 [Pedobacter cryotolerans]
MIALVPGNILRIPSFDFENGAETRDKYLIVIAIANEKALFLRVLTTSKVKVPEDKMMHGCRNEPENGLHYFMFEKDRCMGSLNAQEFSFPLHTFVLFRNNIKEVETVPFIQKYEQTAELVCEMHDTEFLRLKKCIKQNGRMADRSAKRSFPDVFEIV